MSVDHETFLWLVSKDLQEGLSIDESRDLERHLAACPSCRETARGMRRDAAALGSMLTEAPVAPRVRVAVLDSAAGRRRTGVRLVLVLAGLLVVGILGLPLLAGGLGPAPFASSSPSASPPSSTPEPSTSGSPTSSEAPSGGPSAAPAGGSVDGAYSYTVAPGATRRDSVTARLDPGASGEWSRMVPADGTGSSFGGPVTCLVIDGQDAWLAGPATTASDGSTGLAVLLVVHDGGPGGDGDRAITWATDPGQTLDTVEGWCRDKFSPAETVPLDDGSITITPPAD